MKYAVRRKVIKSKSHYLCDYCHFEFSSIQVCKDKSSVLPFFFTSPSINKSTFRKVILSKKKNLKPSYLESYEENVLNCS